MNNDLQSQEKIGRLKEIHINFPLEQVGQSFSQHEEAETRQISDSGRMDNVHQCYHSPLHTKQEQEIYL